MLNFSLVRLSGSKGFLALYSCLIWDAGTLVTDRCSMSQQSTTASDLISDPIAAPDAPAFFPGLLRFPARLLVVPTLDLSEREQQGRAYGMLSY